MSTHEATSQQPLLQAIDLKKHYPVKKGMFAPERLVKALDGVSFNLERGKTLAVVGESGCGKSTLGRLLTMIEMPTGGELYYQGQDLLKHDPQAQKLRRQKIQIVFQNPYGSLNPRKKVGQILEEPLLINTSLSKEQRREKALSMMAKVGLKTEHYDRYPHMFSGGQRQRVGIARSFILRPKLIICDEPTTALDVTIQAQIFELMEKLKREHDTAIMLITHDMGVVSELADDVAVMYMGSIVERGSVREVLKYPAHPYTAALLRSIPILHKGRGQRLEPIRGSTPDPYDRPKGCQFAPRCDFCCEKCRQEMPPEVPVCDGHAVRCWNAEQVYAGHREEVEAV